MSKDWQEQMSLEDIWEQTEGLLSDDFQKYLCDALTPAEFYEVRSSILKTYIDSIIENPNHLSEVKFAALGKMLYQWAVEEAMDRVEHNNSPHQRLG